MMLGNSFQVFKAVLSRLPAAACGSAERRPPAGSSATARVDRGRLKAPALGQVARVAAAALLLAATCSAQSYVISTFAGTSFVGDGGPPLGCLRQVGRRTSAALGAPVGPARAVAAAGGGNHPGPARRPPAAGPGAAGRPRARAGGSPARRTQQRARAGALAAERIRLRPSDPPRTQVQEVAGDEAGVRVFVVHSEEREQYERAQRERAMEALDEQLEALVKRVAAGRLKAPEKVGAAAARILSRHHGQRYFGRAYEARRIRYFEDPQKLPCEKALQGKYWIQSEEQNLTPVEAVSRYQELMAVERALRDLKDVIEMRPIYHQTPRRVEAHIFVAALALLLKHAVQRKLQQAGMDLSAEEALGALGALTTVQLLDLELPDGGAKRLVTRGTRHAQQVLQALGIRDRTPPGGPDRKPRM